MMVYFIIVLAIVGILSSRDEGGDTLLHVAASYISADLITRLLSELPDHLINKLLSTKNGSHQTPLHKAALNKGSETILMELVEYVLKKITSSKQRTTIDKGII